jgi:uncharacterized protein
MLKENALPIQVDPFRFAENAIQLQGTLLLKEMRRLVPSLYEDKGEVKVDLRFGVDAQGVRFLRGELAACLVLKCQRCLESFDYNIAGRFMLGMIHTEEEAASLPQQYDPLVVEENTLILQEVIEDELIVSIPIVPMHAIEECKVKLPLDVETDAKVETDKDNPFKVIEFLRSKH